MPFHTLSFWPVQACWIEGTGGKGKERGDKCGWAVKIIFDFENNLNRYSLLPDSCAILTSFQI